MKLPIQPGQRPPPKPEKCQAPICPRNGEPTDDLKLIETIHGELQWRCPKCRAPVKLPRNTRN